MFLRSRIQNDREAYSSENITKTRYKTAQENVNDEDDEDRFTYQPYGYFEPLGKMMSRDFIVQTQEFFENYLKISLPDEWTEEVDKLRHKAELYFERDIPPLRFIAGVIALSMTVVAIYVIVAPWWLRLIIGLGLATVKNTSIPGYVSMASVIPRLFRSKHHDARNNESNQNAMI